jgi:uncharacterized phage protein (TIGR01671 family)
MKEIKFRVLVEGKWYYFTLDEIMEQATTYQGSLFIKILKAKKQQYTGLKDKNGKEIYEGDILTSINSNNIVVYWDEIHGRWIGHDKKHFNEDLYYYNCGEIIGNIYENPELLK